MSLLFTCGENGCQVHRIDNDYQRIARGQMTRWARREKHIRGIYPSIDEQNDYFAWAYTRLAEIRLVNNKSSIENRK